MNVNDMVVTAEDLAVRCKLQEIFNRQKELMKIYDPIEVASGLTQTEDVPVDMHDRMGQARLKDFAWRITEELTECTDALEKHPNDEVHFREEIIDAFHFYIELMILSDMEMEFLYKSFPDEYELGRESFFDLLVDGADFGIRFNPNPPTDAEKSVRLDEVSVLCWEVTENMGKAMNCLKNKPWKQAQMLTDVHVYQQHILYGLFSMFRLMLAVGMASDDMYEMYILKNKVNKFRQKSNY